LAATQTSLNSVEIRGFCGVTNATARISAVGHDPLKLRTQVVGASRRGTRNDQHHRQFFPLRTDLQHVRHHRQPRRRLDRDRAVIRPGDGHLIRNRYRTRQSEDLRHGPPDDKILVSVCAYEQHSGNHPSQHGRSLACKLSLCAGDPPRRSKRSSLPFVRFLVPAALPVVADPRWRRLEPFVKTRQPHGNRLPLPHQTEVTPPCRPVPHFIRLPSSECSSLLSWRRHY